ncbi:predicted protein [Verticillium alfalfae VaMs.102]|uniref:Predicted protein n=1 Tax=Verticillium alfalfae (strain VaMs.102 / ATCC MYA-4576 / FGSC 10136) TaxID=526221 RepID=C9SB14_VERA1|nr:predicted protein [Verticillium alfalfae VaMs.102]EEY16374.1 predicted protein [Verticillium alfalfae VaMs.102]
MRNLTPGWNNPSASPAATRRLPDGRQHRECTRLSKTKGRHTRARRALIKSLRHIALVGSQEGPCRRHCQSPHTAKDSSTTMGTGQGSRLYDTESDPRKPDGWRPESGRERNHYLPSSAAGRRHDHATPHLRGLGGLEELRGWGSPAKHIQAQSSNIGDGHGSCRRALEVPLPPQHLKARKPGRTAFHGQRLGPAKGGEVEQSRPNRPWRVMERDGAVNWSIYRSLTMRREE